ncbi:MAG TPA: VOC family protein [Thermoplasmata archaeon]|nr:VOC family protein [Thermoplasmata archaeon]
MAASNPSTARSRVPRPPEGGLAFTELASRDPPATRRFLESVFGWRFESVQMPMGEYLSYRTPDGQGGVRPVRPPESPSSLAYVRVADLAGARARIERAGGTVVLAPVDVPGMGSFFWFQVPGGPMLACWQDASPDTPPRKEEPR